MALHTGLLKKIIRHLQTGVRSFASEKGYATSLTLVALPFIVGMAAWSIDGARVVNLHTDLQHAADAMALAGARELDGRDDAIIRARIAMSNLLENRAHFAEGGNFLLGNVETVSFSIGGGADNSVDVEFLENIPRRDQDPFETDLVTSDPNLAAYVRVMVRPKNVNTIFPLPVLGFDTVPVSAEATATYVASACDLTPIFICNPFESTDVNTSVGDLFRQGRFYAREFRLMHNGSSSAGPGNFGFLQTSGPGAEILRRVLATGNSNVCFRRGALVTEPGAIAGPTTQGINTRFGIYAGPTNSSRNDPAFAPDENIRIGQSQGTSNGNGNGGGNNGPSCSVYDPVDNAAEATPFPTGTIEQNVGGGTFHLPDWDINLYWDISHNSSNGPSAVEVDGVFFERDNNGNPVLDANGQPVIYNPPPAPNISQVNNPVQPPPINSTPSRYDTYLQEIRDGLTGNSAPNGETGQSQAICSSQGGVSGRREIFAAIINCGQQNEDGFNGRTAIEAEAFARMFLTRPAVSNGNDRFLSLEVIDVSGEGGLGTVEDVLREEAELVR